MTSRTKAIGEAVAKSAPNPDRPRLSEEFEKRLHDTDRERAACYAQIEDVSEQAKKVADELSSDPECAVPIEVEADEETSLVIAIAQVRDLTAS